MAKEFTLSTGNLPRGGLPRNSVVRITDRPDMTSAVYHGRKALNQTNKGKQLMRGAIGLSILSVYYTCRGQAKVLNRLQRFKSRFSHEIIFYQEIFFMILYIKGTPL